MYDCFRRANNEQKLARVTRAWSVHQSVTKELLLRCCDQKCHSEETQGTTNSLSSNWRYRCARYFLFVLVHIAMKSFLSSTPKPTRLTRPNRARASAILSRNALSSFVALTSLPSSSKASVSPDESVTSTADDFDVNLVDGLRTYSAILVRTLCVGLLHRFHRKRK